MSEKKILKAEKKINIRFSEVDSMNIVWHGSYSLYFEDAREEFGKQFHLDYLYMFKNGFFAPLVDLHFNFKRPLKYKDEAIIEISFRDTVAAKLIFDYTIYSSDKTQIIATGYSTQVFLDKNYKLVWSIPDFIVEWKKMNGIL
ncbi:MAG: acyl-CoA thioesterase [Bacteroidales bacterium]|jgi:acyl-CoA thioester hydrolase|nr:acyl-CoA thioesterase [Bacteroidales bacterium]